MPSATDLRRIALRRDKILEVQWAELPEAPPQLMKLPGFQEWYQQLKLLRERDVRTFGNLINNLQIASRPEE